MFFEKKTSFRCFDFLDNFVFSFSSFLIYLIFFFFLFSRILFLFSKKKLSPSEISRGETLSTLQFADRAKKVTVHAYANEELATGNELIKANHEIQRLRDMLRSLGGGSLVGSNSTHGLGR